MDQQDAAEGFGFTEVCGKKHIDSNLEAMTARHGVRRDGQWTSKVYAALCGSCCVQVAPALGSL